MCGCTTAPPNTTKTATEIRQEIEEELEMTRQRQKNLRLLYPPIMPK